jgi:hypothetical protein
MTFTRLVSFLILISALLLCVPLDKADSPAHKELTTISEQLSSDKLLSKSYSPQELDYLIAAIGSSSIIDVEKSNSLYIKQVESCFEFNTPSYQAKLLQYQQAQTLTLKSQQKIVFHINEKFRFILLNFISYSDSSYIFTVT